MTQPTFGIVINRQSGDPRPAVDADMSVIGLVGTAESADAARFPLDTPVAVFSDDETLAADLGADGTLLDAIELINQQLADYQVAARVVIVRVAEGDDAAETITNLAGSSTENTGIHALEDAGVDLGVVPRLIVVPGYTSQQFGAVTGVNVTNGGSGYTTATVTFAGGGAGATVPEGEAVITDGVITAIEITKPGQGLSEAPTISITGDGSGAAATVDFDANANPVVAQLPSLCAKLIAHAICDAPDDSLASYTTWRETSQAGRIIPVATSVKVGVDAAVKPASPAIAGIAVRRDYEYNGVPSHSWANQPIHGIVGANRPIKFSITDGATEGQAIMALRGGVIVRGEAGVADSIAEGGYVYVGTDTLNEDTLWQFYNVSRMRDYINIRFLKTLRWYLGRFNISGQTIQAIVNTMEFMLRDLKASGDIIDYRVGFTRDANSPEQLRMGRFTVDYYAEEPPVLRRIDINSRRYRPALDTLLDELLAQVDVAN